MEQPPYGGVAQSSDERWVLQVLQQTGLGCGDSHEPITARGDKNKKGDRGMNQSLEQDRTNQSEAIYAGVMAGLIAGIAMAVVSMIMALLTGEGFWAPVKKVSVTLLGASAAQEPGFQFMPVMVGMMIHFVTAIALGIIFALLGGRRSSGSAVASGIGYGLAIWLVMQFIVLPFVNPVMADMPPLQFAMLHMICGGTLGSYQPKNGSQRVMSAPFLRATRAEGPLLRA
jgi:uncharacterized membrane protein YagU involved in acid resistance